MYMMKGSRERQIPLALSYGQERRLLCLVFMALLLTKHLEQRPACEFTVVVGAKTPELAISCYYSKVNACSAEDMDTWNAGNEGLQPNE